MNLQQFRGGEGHFAKPRSRGDEPIIVGVILNVIGKTPLTRG